MKSASGAHFAGLDHVRAIAAYLVFAWHFMHGDRGSPVAFEGAPLWGPLALVDEGHVGVALFMTLSGYLFAKLLDGRQMRIGGFLWNRVLRLGPLLLVVLLASALIKASGSGGWNAALTFIGWLPYGLIAPIWPNGGWSITVELHFYLLLPLLLALQRRSMGLLLFVVVSALVLRTGLWLHSGSVQKVAYLTIAGRIDQFVFGILAFGARRHMTGRHGRAAVVAVAFMSAYHAFASAGGYYGLGGYPSRSPIWIVLPTLEGFAFATLIAWYDSSFVASRGWLSMAIAKIGEYSYSIYLLHFFVVFRAADWIHRELINLSNFYVATVAATACFLFMIPIGWVSMTFIEAPFLKLRRPYVDESRNACVAR